MKTTELEQHEFSVISQRLPDKEVWVHIKVLYCMIMYVAIYSHIFNIKSEISPMKISVWGHSVLSKKFPEESSRNP